MRIWDAKKKLYKMILAEIEAIKRQIKIYTLILALILVKVPKRFLLVTATTGDHPGDDLKRRYPGHGTNVAGAVCTSPTTALCSGALMTGH